MVTLTAILLLVVTAAALWRLVRLAIAVALLLALLGLIALYSAQPAHRPHARTSTTTTRRVHRHQPSTADSVKGDTHAQR